MRIIGTAKEKYVFRYTSYWEILDGCEEGSHFFIYESKKMARILE